MLALANNLLANLAKGFAIALPAQIFPGVAERDQRVRKIIFQALRAVGEFLDVFENFLFVRCAVHETKISAAHARNYRADVPNR